MRIQSPTISLTTTKDGQTGASAFVHIKYSDDGQTFTGHDGEDIGKFMGIYTDDVEQDSTTFADYTWNKIVGDDAYTVVLTNENFSFAVDSNRKPLSNQSVQVGFIIFRGTQQVTNFTIGTVTPPTGISYSELNGVITFSVSTTTSLTADSGSILIPINITSSLTIQKYATWSLSYKGNTGDTGGKGDKGDTGATVSTQKDQYYLSTSNIELLGDTWHDGDPPSIPTGKYLWTRVENTMTDGTTVHSNAVYKSTIQGLVSDVDNVKGSITNKVWESDITSELTAYDGGTSSVTNTVRNRVSQTEQDITGITSRVGAVESTTTGLSTRMTTAESNITQNANKIAAAVTVTEDGQTHETSITLTPEMLEAVTDQFVVESPDGNRTVIANGQMSTDAIKSNNYVDPTSSTTPFSASGSFLNLANGDITTPSFSVDHSGDAKIGNNTNYVQFNGQTGVLSANVSSLSIGGTPAATSTQVNDARKVATNYLYYDTTNGLVVHQNNSEISSVSDLTGNVGNVRITGDGMDIYRGQTKTASYGSEVVIGPSILSSESPSNIRINTNGFQYNNAGDEAFYVGVEQRVVETSEESTQNAVLPEDTIDRTVANDEYVYVGDLPPDELRLTMEVDPNVPEEVIVCNSYLDLSTYTQGGKTKYSYKVAELPHSNHLTLKRLKPDSVVRTSDGAQMEYSYYFAENSMEHDEIWVHEDYHVTYRMVTYKAKYNFISASTFRVIQESNINPGYYDLLRYKIDNDHVLAVLNNANDVSFIYRANSSIIQVNGLNYFRIGTNNFNKVEVDANGNIVIKGGEHRWGLYESVYEHTGYETKIIDNTTYYKAGSDSIIYSRKYYIDGFSDTEVVDGIAYYKIGEHPLSFSLRPNSVQYMSSSTHGSGAVQYYTVTKTDTYEIWSIDYIDVVYTIYTNEKNLSINAYYDSDESPIDYVLEIDNNIYTIWVPDYHGISVDVDTIWTHYGLKHSGEIQIVDGKIYTNHYQNYFINYDNGVTTSPSEDVMLVAQSDTTINSNTFIERAELATRTYYKVYDIPENVIVKSVVKSSDHSIVEYYIQNNGLWVADDFNVIYTIAYVGDTTSPYFVFGPNNYSSALPAGKYSFAAGEYCSAQGSDQFVIGKYNERKTSPAFIIGNGEADNNRSNALEIDWHGNVMTHGSLYSENVMTYGSLYSENDDITATEINNYVFG